MQRCRFGVAPGDAPVESLVAVGVGFRHMPARRSPVFRGRTSERDQLRGLLEKVRGGESAAVVVRGEAGIGKTALIDHCVEQAAGFHVVRIAGAESEMELPFAGLHQLCAPMLPQVESLPEPQQNALRVAFGLLSGDAPDRFLVALATLGLLSEVALARPLAVVVDDAQWLDAASAQVFAFVGRRILAESVLMLFAVREPTEDRQLAGLPELILHGLDDHDARELLLTAIPGRVDIHVRDRIVAETRGNPLALLELPTGMTAAELAGGFPVPYSGELPVRLQEHFLRRLEALPEATQRLMLIAAADPTGDVSLLWRAAATLGIGREAAAADAEQLIEIAGRVRFRHPLVRSAIYSGAPTEDRRAVHLALAAAMDPRTDPDRRAWHLALAAAGPDEEVASELERSAGRAQSRGGLAAAAAFLQRSVALTPDPQRRVDRALAAAQAQIHAGAFDEALKVLAVAETDAETELQRVQLELLRAHIAFGSGFGGDAPGLLLSAAVRLEKVDIGLARETYLNAWAAALFAGPFAGTANLRAVSIAARAAPRPSGARRTLDLMLDGFAALVIDGRDAAAPLLKQVASAFVGTEVPIEEALRVGQLAPVAPYSLYDDETLQTIVARQLQLARDAGALARMSVDLNVVGTMETFFGEFAAAARANAEADAIAEATGTRMPPLAAMCLAALQGREAEASVLINAVITSATSGGQGVSVQYGRWAAAVLFNGLGRYEEAVSSAQRAADDTPEMYVSRWALPEVVEAAVRTGRLQLAADSVDRFAVVTQASGTNWALGIEARSRALVTEGEPAEDLYREAVDRLRRTRLRPELARAHLLYGEWLRRQRRRVDARDQLRIAHDMSTEIGMLAFAERALRELRATGATVRKRREDTRDDLTPQEELIARLAIEGRTNPEIGAQLFLSPRTVEWHLRKVFAKLGITSRRGLRDALPARAAVASGN
jgi:DNA-binding CsgD family transcriptional regulator